MPTTIGDILAGQTRPELSRGEAAMARLRKCLDADGPIVTWLHGPPGAGKTGLLEKFLPVAEAEGAATTVMDCRTIEPTVAGFVAAVGEITHTPVDSVETAAAALSRDAGTIVIAFTHYEVFRLADGWLRRDFIPALPQSARVLFVSREPPGAGWVGSSRWRRHFSAVALDAAGAPEPEALVQRCIDDAAARGLSDAVEAISVVRRVTRPMLASLCPGSNEDELFEALEALACVERRRDGLALHDGVRRIIAERLQAADPDRYRDYQRAAWKQLRRQLRTSSPADLWRCTADVIYLIENPVIREAFFPSESAAFFVERAMADDRRAIVDITEAHEPDAAVAAIETWWRHLPTAFHVVRDSTGSIVGYYCLAKPDEIGGAWMQEDPVARAWQAHLFSKGRHAGVPALFLRRWLSADAGEAPCPVQAAAWVDIKRSYLELRPELRRVYLPLRNVAPYGPVATELGFRVLDESAVTLGGATYHSAMLDFGPGSVDGWICDLLAAELGVGDDQLLDAAARELVIDGERVPLTPLEFGVVSLLESHSGEAVSREELLRQVWGRSFDGSSNVVDVVVRGLRKKLGDSAAKLETVRGVGYRLRATE